MRDLWPKMDSDNAEQIVRCLCMIIEALQGKESGDNLQALLETELLDSRVAAGVAVCLEQLVA